MPGGLPLDQVTIAEGLAHAGYARAFVGKWHLGVGDYLPTGQGFEHYFGVPHGLGACPCHACFAPDVPYVAQLTPPWGNGLGGRP